MNRCRSCGEDFGSVALFDAHRIGKHAYTLAEGLKHEPPVEDGRGCVYVEEMLERGWERNERGRWSDPARHPGARLCGTLKRTEVVTEQARDDHGEELAA